MRRTSELQRYTGDTAASEIRGLAALAASEIRGLATLAATALSYCARRAACALAPSSCCCSAE